jgi:hypothetical protein
MTKNIILLSFILLAFGACKKKYDVPPIDISQPGTTITLDSLLGLFNGNPIKFTEDISLYATVTMDESDGNLYKNVYIQDGDKAVNMRMLSSGGLYVGDSIRIDLKGSVLSSYNGVIQIDSVHTDRQITILAVDKDIEPLALNLTDVNTNLQSRLIKLENVQFTVPELDLTYADATNKLSRDIIIEDCDGNSLIFRNSGYAAFADETIAQGNGSITAIVGVFNSDVQLLVRSFDEIKMDGERCAGQVIVKNFNDESITSGGWQIQQVVGTDAWETNDQGASSFYAQISNYNGSGNNACESWLISPSIDLLAISEPQFSFRNACNYNGPQLQLLISTDYAGEGDPTVATWTSLAPILSTGSWAWVSSGMIDLSAFNSASTYIAFKYLGGTGDGKTWEIDDIVLTGKL